MRTSAQSSEPLPAPCRCPPAARAAAVEAGGQHALGLAEQAVGARVDVAAGRLDQAVGVEHERVAARSTPRSVSDAAQVGDDAEHDALGPGDAPAARRPRRSAPPGGCPAEAITYSPEARSSERCTAVTKPSVAARAAHVGVAGGQESSRGTEPSRPPKAPDSSSARVPASMPLPDTSTSATSSVLPSKDRHHEIAAERGAAGRPEHDRGAPALAEPGQLALGLDAVPQLEQHPVAAQALDAELLPGPGQDVGEDRGQHDGRHDARRRPCPSPGRRSRRPRRRRRRYAAPGATSAGRRPGSARSSRRARTTTPRRARRPPRWRSPRPTR